MVPAGAANSTCTSFSIPTESVVVSGFGDNLEDCYVVFFSTAGCAAGNSVSKTISLDPAVGAAKTCQEITVGEPAKSVQMFCTTF